MFSDDDLLPLSALAHLLFCERRAALVHIECQWGDNSATLEGTHLHQQVDLPGVESRGDLRIARGLLVNSHRLGLSGKLDVVEFHREEGSGGRMEKAGGKEDEDREWVGEETGGLKEADGAGLATTGAAETAALRGPRASRPPQNDGDSALGGRDGRAPGPRASRPPAAIPLPNLPGLWAPFPVEYKKGRLRKEEGYEVQLCAQALCLEEMLNVHIPAGAIYYGANRRRLDIDFTDELRTLTGSAAARLHEVIRAGLTPKAFREPKCERCSLLDRCRPEALAPGKSAKEYLTKAIDGERRK